jgi:hypothetical protein
MHVEVTTICVLVRFYLSNGYLNKDKNIMYAIVHVVTLVVLDMLQTYL